MMEFLSMEFKKDETLPKRRSKCSAPYTLEGEILPTIASSYC